MLLHVAIGLVAIRDQVCSAPSRETEYFRIQAREFSSEASLLSSFKNLRYCLSLLFAEFLRVLCGRSLRTPRFKVLMTPGKNKVLIRGDRRETAAEHAETERRCQRIFSLVETETLPQLAGYFCLAECGLRGSSDGSVGSHWYQNKGWLGQQLRRWIDHS